MTEVAVTAYMTYDMIVIVFYKIIADLLAVFTTYLFVIIFNMCNIRTEPNPAVWRRP